jgi:enoyl-CoA hydratase
MGPSATAAALGGEPVTADDALRLGWVDVVVEREKLLDAASDRARILGALAPDAYAFTKAQLHRPARAAMQAGAEEDAAVRTSWCSEDTRARIAAFLADLAR